MRAGPSTYVKTVSSKKENWPPMNADRGFVLSAFIGVYQRPIMLLKMPSKAWNHALRPQTSVFGLTKVPLMEVPFYFAFRDCCMISHPIAPPINPPTSI